MLSLEKKEWMLNNSVLCVDDDTIILEIMESFLGKFFETVYLAKDGKEALELFHENFPAMVITDISMPNTTGTQLVSQIKELSTETILIYMSGVSDKRNLLEALRSKPDEFIEKPFDADTLFSALSNALDEKVSSLSHTYQFKDGTTFSEKDACLCFDDEKMALTFKENILLSLLLRHRDTLVPYSNIEFHVWGGEIMTDGALKTLLYRLRSKLKHNYIKVSPNLGLSFVG